MLKDNLAMLRRILGFSQEEVAEKVGVSRQAYAKWESGVTVPDIEKCARLAEIYNVTIDSLIKVEQVEGIGTVPPAQKGNQIWGTVFMNERGQIVIPKPARDRFGLGLGSRLIVLSDSEGIALVPADTFEEKMRTMMMFAARKADN